MKGVGINLNITSKGIGLTSGPSDIGLMDNIYSLTQGLSMRNWAKEEAEALNEKGLNGNNFYEGIGYNYTYGDSLNLLTLERLKNGFDSYEFGEMENENARALTTADEEGKRKIRFGSLGSGTEFAVDLAHESWRDGYENIGTYETVSSVISHTKMANALMKEHGRNVFSNRADLQFEADIYEEYGTIGLATYAAEAYDSSADYWLLTLDGEIVWDDENHLNKEYLDENGEVKERRVLTDKTGSRSKSLMKYIGKDNTLEILSERGIDISGMNDTELAYALMTSSGTEWIDGVGYSKMENNGIWDDKSLVERLTFNQLSDDIINLYQKQNTLDRTQEDPLTILEDILPINQNIRPNSNIIDMKGVVVHYTGSQGATAQNTSDYFKGLANQVGSDPIQASAHYAIGYKDGEIIKMVPEDMIAWTSGGKKYTDLANELFEKPNGFTSPNSYTVGIETNPVDSLGNFSMNAYTSTVKLTADILYRNDLNPIENLWRHYDMTGKPCPKAFQPDITNPDGSTQTNKNWDHFKADVYQEMSKLSWSNGFLDWAEFTWENKDYAFNLFKNKIDDWVNKILY